MELEKRIDLEDGWTELWIDVPEQDTSQDLRIDLLEINKMLYLS